MSEIKFQTPEGYTYRLWHGAASSDLDLTVDDCDRAIAGMTADGWEPFYEYWRHGGSYVLNVRYPGGSCGCIASARHTQSKLFEIACDPRPWVEVDGKLRPPAGFKTRDAAARAERDMAVAMWRDLRRIIVTLEADGKALADLADLHDDATPGAGRSRGSVTGSPIDQDGGIPVVALIEGIDA